MLMLMLVLVSCIAAVVNSQGSSSERNILKQRFKQGCSAAIENEPDLDASEVDAYTEYVEQFDKLDRYLNDGCNFTRNYRAYQRNKRRIDELNANAPPAEVVNGRVFKQSYAVNEFADCDDDCRKEYLEEINTDPNGVHRRLGEGDNMAECIQLDPNHFADGNADATVQDSMWSEDSACGAVKDQGVDGACWAFAATAQFQCNFNVAHQEKRVFSEKYATDCSDEQSVSMGGVLGYLDEWYTENGACSDYYKAWDKHDKTDYDGDCDCESEKAYGQCYTFSPSVDSAGKLAIANAAQLYALSFAIDLCRSFYDLAGDNAVWYGCRPDEERLAGHAMTIVGQEVGRYVLVRNSWGNGTGYSVPWGSRAEPGHVWFHSDVWTSDVSHGWPARFYFNYFPPQAQSEHEAPTAKCHEQGPCDSGFMDTSDGLYTDGTSDEGGRCPLDCEGGAFVDSACNCVCQAAGMCDSVRGLGAIGGDENGCPLVSSGFGYSDFNGEWAYAGEFNEKAYYQHDQHADFFVAYSGSGYYKYVITADMRGGSAYCNCHANELTECEWYCWDGVHESATALVYVRDEEGVCAQPTGEEEEEEEGEDWACPLVSSGFSYDWGWFDGNWTYLGDYEGKPYYQHKYYTYYFLLYSDYLEDYMITWDITSWESYEVGDASYCRCGAVKLSKCEWKCWDEIEASATFLTNCDSSSHSNVKEEEEEEEEEEVEEEEEGECPLVSSGFSYTWGWFNGDWTYLGDYDGKPSYQHNTNTYYFLLYSDYLEDYMITYDITRYESYQVGDASYCRCNASELSKCEWTCWGDIQVAAKILTNCDSSSSSSSHSNVKIHQIKLVKPSGVELIAITTNEALAVVVALLICVNVCVAMELMRRRAGAWCRKTSYAKVQMVDEDSEAVMQSEAEQILQVSN